MVRKIHLLFWKLWESRVPEFARVMRTYFQYKHARKIPLLQFIPIGWRYAKMGFEFRVQRRMTGTDSGSVAEEQSGGGDGTGA